MEKEKEYKCPYCKDTGFIIKDNPEGNKRYGKSYITERRAMCVCSVCPILNEKFPILSVVPNPSVEMAIKVVRKFGDKNMIFFGSQEKYLFYFKCYASVLFNTTKKIELMKGIEYVHNYYVTDKGTDFLNSYTLLGIMCTSTEKNIAISDTVLSLVKDRLLLKKPTWLYTYDSVSFQNSKEYSEELKAYMEVYESCTLKGTDSRGKILNKINELSQKNIRLAQDNAANV